MQTDQKSRIFAAIQVVGIAYLLLSGPVIISNIPYLLVQVFSLLLIVWAVIAKKVNRHHHPTKLPHGAFLVTKGPYEIIRHPVYAGMLLFALSYIQGYFTFLRLIVFLVLVVITLLKMAHEERTVAEHVKDYKEYQEKTHRIIPYVF